METTPRVVYTGRGSAEFSFRPAVFRHINTREQSGGGGGGGIAHLDHKNDTYFLSSFSSLGLTGDMKLR